MAGICSVCGKRTNRGPRCATHQRRSQGTGSAVHSDPQWTLLSRTMIAHHVGQYGWVCPGDGPEHPAHPSRALTTDHVVQLQEGGAPFDRANTRVLCRSRNSANGARLAIELKAGRLPPRIPVALDERAEIRARYLG